MKADDLALVAKKAAMTLALSRKERRNILI